MGLRVLGVEFLGFNVPGFKGSGFKRFEGLGFRIWGLGSKDWVQDLGRGV